MEAGPTSGFAASRPPALRVLQLRVLGGTWVTERRGMRNKANIRMAPGRRRGTTADLGGQVCWWLGTVDYGSSVCTRFGSQIWHIVLLAVAALLCLIGTIVGTVCLVKRARRQDDDDDDDGDELAER